MLGDAVERAAAAVEVVEEESGGVQLTTEVLALEAGEAAAVDVLVREGHQVPACVSCEEHPAREALGAAAERGVDRGGRGVRVTDLVGDEPAVVASLVTYVCRMQCGPS
ncbi:hypothetical protein NRK68_26345 [Streptomyces yangpuensis]|uniref:Uncharacterized protein n=1 Tax=Streptomyces yangpuensis TaxID=1648182 RepID=A0ABY5Q2M7_9ACTN|nr:MULTISPECIES: hypothetical protein [Streptomyces]UUY50432.1 hypothetical protein NRK68_26345 [Streptomyces yangpuensis]